MLERNSPVPDVLSERRGELERERERKKETKNDGRIPNGPMILDRKRQDDGGDDERGREKTSDANRRRTFIILTCLIVSIPIEELAF